ncbi:HD domain-containing response regulator [Holdemania filiformis]|uniref:HD domain-containing response regulator n=1 Tax=Holdemania filiformis TaxID=61171 RepID=UPI002109C1C8|nr:HD domain-containing response regulator [Holdemania filiformis]MCQ4951794.1 HD domain-containing protein [Holdemania filiformis]
MRKNRKGQIHNEFRLLVLNDDEMITLALRAYFEGCGYTVDIESNPLRAIEKIRLDHYDILLLDFLMNPICGDKVVEEIRKFNTDLFIILLTGHKDLAPPVKTIRELDIQGYYEKSDKFDQLELLVESCVKSIRQMQTIRRYRDGLNEVLNDVTTLYQDQNPQQLIAAIVGQVRSLCQEDDVFVMLNPQNIPAFSEKVSLVSSLLLSGSGDYELDAAQFMRLYYPHFLDAIQRIKSSRQPDLCEQRLALPLHDESGHFLGMIGIRFKQTPADTLIQLLTLYSRQAGSAIARMILHTVLQSRNDQLKETNKQLKDSYMETITAVRLMVEAKDIYTRGHSDRVSYYTTLLAKKRIPDPQRLERIRLAGLFHDVGKIGVPDSILTKLGPLSEEEYAQIRCHSELGCQILSAMSFFQEIAGIIRSHHERWDGKGYPDGLAGTQIPLESRMIAVADAFDAMTSFRAYRQSLSLDQARAELIRNKGTQFDPELVDDFIEILNDYDQIHAQLEWTFHEL